MEQNNSEFHCVGCGACCRWEGIVRINDAEIADISNYLNINELEFIERYTRLAPDRRGLVLLDAPDGACCFLTPDNRCRIHPVKPRQCRDFPKTWSVPPELMARCKGGMRNEEWQGFGGGAP
ncbi:MAG: YkgJ family cysteine cluster protein [Victivallales bacterium]|nr:YkgJ family cysteine cluster protein [Victivallales bacterium]